MVVHIVALLVGYQYQRYTTPLGYQPLYALAVCLRIAQRRAIAHPRVPVQQRETIFRQFLAKSVLQLPARPCLREVHRYKYPHVLLF